MNSYRVEACSGGSFVVGAASPRAAARLVGRLYRVAVRGVCLAEDTRRQLKDQPNLLHTGKRSVS